MAGFPSGPADLIAPAELLLLVSMLAVCAELLSADADEATGGSDPSTATELSMLTRSAADLHVGTVPLNLQACMTALSQSVSQPWHVHSTACMRTAHRDNSVRRTVWCGTVETHPKDPIARAGVLVPCESASLMLSASPVSEDAALLVGGSTCNATGS